MDTNADTCCLGTNYVVLAYTNRVADVYSYDPKAPPVHSVPIVQGATAYDGIRSIGTIILVINEALYYGKELNHTLLNPNQIRSHGYDVEDNPFRGTIGITINPNTFVPFQTSGTKIFFETRVPTDDELADCPHFEMTSPREWEPTKVQLQSTQTLLLDSNDNHEDDSLLTRMLSQVVVEYDPDTMDRPIRRTFVSKERHPVVDAKGLSERFNIGYKQAQATLLATTQRGV